MELQRLALSQIDRPITPDRLSLDHNQLNELALSMRNEGLLQPIVVRPTAYGRFEIVAGDRRYQAAQSLRWDHIDCVIRNDLEGLGGDGRLAENIHRAALTPMEEALAIERLTRDANLTTHDVAARLHRSATWVTQRRALLNVPADLKELVHRGEIAINTALHLARVDDLEHRTHLLDYARRSGASAEVIREWVNEWTTHRDAGTPEAAPSPQLPPAGQPIIVLVPCYICHQPTPHTQMIIARLCTHCHAGVQQTNRDDDATTNA